MREVRGGDVRFLEKQHALPAVRAWELLFRRERRGLHSMPRGNVLRESQREHSVRDVRGRNVCGPGGAVELREVHPTFVHDRCHLHGGGMLAVNESDVLAVQEGAMPAWADQQRQLVPGLRGFQLRAVPSLRQRPRARPPRVQLPDVRRRAGLRGHAWHVQVAQVRFREQQQLFPAGHVLVRKVQGVHVQAVRAQLGHVRRHQGRVRRASDRQRRVLPALQLQKVPGGAVRHQPVQRADDERHGDVHRLHELPAWILPCQAALWKCAPGIRRRGLERRVQRTALRRHRHTQQRRGQRLRAVRHVPQRQVRIRRRAVHGQRHLEGQLRVHGLQAVRVGVRARCAVRRAVVQRLVQALPRVQPRVPCHLVLERHEQADGVQLQPVQGRAG